MKRWSGNNRARGHDYASKSIYHITMVKAEGVGQFGRLAGNIAVPVGVQGSPYIIASPIGNAIKAALRMIPTIHPALRLYQYALMPDHLHIVIAAEEQLDEAIGRKLARFKRLAAEYAGLERVFERGFNDQILYRSRSLDAVFRYLKENPYRLAVRRSCPQHFRRVNNLTIGGLRCSAYGNMHLLDNPFKEQVVVHRADDKATRQANRERWLYTAANGGVLVSPFISPAEKGIRSEADALDARIILITNEMMGERYKPAAADFALCTQGRLLIISPDEISHSETLTRETCLAMNSLAENISRG